ncbi:MarR family transcriptional regulator [Desulfosporosinus sp. Sb-LF]|uniref:MarR family winged helix-turn-helix transcriptional regulator n=1 Tax=Desulfosporosinus sp. Sb-LF TaxID=2560027 RepID=UPI00107F9DC4|nr:MarR family transcriptional regulator [Desulfosporosinus sp. Sb-LF]TGE31745.1 MarR family transcriptional regulator [Desulfosporosinus sp. Sb-LF]
MNEENEQNYDLTEQFTRMEWLLHRYHQQNHTHHGPMGDPRKGQGRVLAVLKMQPEISQKELLFLLDMRPQSLGELLTKLEKNGYITRTQSETDRRIMNIKLTKEGTEATTEQEFSFDKLFECLSEEEQINLSIYLNRIIETIEAQLGDEQPGPGFDPRQRGGNPFDPRFGFDPHSEMGHGPGMMPFGRSPGMNRGHGEWPAPPQKKPDEE